MPEVSAVHVNRWLTNMAIGYPVQEFAADRIFPELPVARKSDSYLIFDPTQRGWAQTDDNRAPGGESLSVDWKTSEDTYRCSGHALNKVIPDEERENADPPIKPDIDATDFVVGRVLLNKEIDAKAKLDAALSSSNVSVKWSTPATSTPNSDINTALLAIRNATGFRPNIAVMDLAVWLALKDHPDIVERVVYGGGNTNPALVSEATFAALFGLEEVVVTSALKNTAKAGQNASTSPVWAKDFYLAYRASRPGIRVPTLGYTFSWRPFSGGLKGWMVKRWREEKKSSFIVEASKYYDQKICLSTAGYKLNAVIA